MNDSKPGYTGRVEQMWSGAVETKAARAPDRSASEMREDRSASANARIGRVQGADARPEQWIRAQLTELARMISEWPGLVARPEPALVEDALVLLEHLGDARKVVDVGSGAGLPGLPLKIARPDLDLCLIEADQSKAAFLVHACATLGLSGVEVVARRAEDAGHDPRLRESFDVAVARALAPLPVLVELCLPFVRVGGQLLAQKTEGDDPGAARYAIEVLGGALVAVRASPSAARQTGTVVVIEKVRRTPDAYPRRAGVPARKPL